MTDFYPILLPRRQILDLLSNSIKEHMRLAELLAFNQEHGQWDLLLSNLAKMEDQKCVIKECAQSLQGT